MNRIRYCLLAGLVCLTIGLTGQETQLAKAKAVEGFDGKSTVAAFAVASDNTRYIATDRGLLRIDTAGVVEPVLGGKRITSVALDDNDQPWVGIFPNTVYDPSNGTAIEIEGEEGLEITCMDFSGSQLWVGTNQGVFVVSTKYNKVVEHHTPANSRLESSMINTIHIEKSKLKWIGTDRGVVRIENTKWKAYEQNHVIKAITENIEGVWIASETEIWLVDPYNRWAPADLNDGLGEGEVRSLAADRKGKIYILSEVLVQFDPYTDEAVEITYSLDSTATGDILMYDLEDNLWVGSAADGLLAMNTTELEELPLTAYARIEHPRCSGDRNGAIAITTAGGSPPYEFTWEGRDLFGPEVSELAAGVYYLLVSDFAGDEQFMEIELTDPQPLTADIEILSEISVRGASDASIQVDPNGGTGEITARWSDGDSSLMRQDLSAGSYSVTITDANGCTAEDLIEIPRGPQAIASSDEPLEAVDAASIQSLTVSTLAVGQTLRIEQLRFKADSATIEDDSYEVLDELSKFLMNNPDLVIEIGGHTNGLPDHAYCDRLSTERAQTVAEYLYSKGIPTTRIAYKGYGKRNPIASNGTPEGRRKNQRVEIKVLSI